MECLKTFQIIYIVSDYYSQLPEDQCMINIDGLFFLFIFSDFWIVLWQWNFEWVFVPLPMEIIIRFNLSLAPKHPCYVIFLIIHVITLSLSLPFFSFFCFWYYRGVCSFSYFFTTYKKKKKTGIWLLPQHLYFKKETKKKNQKNSGATNSHGKN